MATLEKIRSKSVLLLVIIAVALLAFILGDFLTSGRSYFGTGTTLAQVDGTKIDINEFQQRMELASQQAQQQGRQVDSSVLQQQVLNSMIAEKLFENEVEQLGIVVTDDELTQAMLGPGSEAFSNYVSSQTGVESAAVLHDMVVNPARYELDADQAAQLNAIWVDYERQMELSLKQQKFNNLFMGTITANALDAKNFYDENATRTRIALARNEYNKLNNDEYPVTDDEIRAEWNKSKNNYIIPEDQRLVRYISVEIAPSAADLQAGSKKVEDALAGLNANEGTQGLEGMSEFIAERTNYTASALKNNRNLKAFIDSTAVGRAGIVTHNGTNYTLAKYLGSKQDIDSVNIDYLAVQGTRAQIDSMIAALNGGADFATVAAGELVAQAQDSTWVSLVAPQMAALKQTLADATPGRWFSPDTIGQGGRIFRVRTRRAPVTVYDIATINYSVEPSAATVNSLNSDLARYVNANTDVKSFVEGAIEAGYTVQEAVIGASTPRLGNLDESHNAVAWAMEAKKGQVSPVLGDETTGRYIAVAVENIFDDGYLTPAAPSVMAEIETRLRNNKKGAALMEKYAGKAKDVAGYAEAFGAKVDTANVTFGQPFIPHVGYAESVMHANVLQAKPGQVVGPLQGKAAIYVFSIIDSKDEGRPYDFDESAANFNQQRGAGALGRNINAIIQGKNKVKNNTLDFYR